jgi:hypothetical protein
MPMTALHGCLGFPQEIEALMALLVPKVIEDFI